MVLPFLYHIETCELQEYNKKHFSKLRLRLFWHCAEAHYWCFSDFSWFVTVRLHTLRTMVPQFACWSIGIFQHQCGSHLHSLLYLWPESYEPFHFFDIIAAFMS